MREAGVAEPVEHEESTTYAHAAEPAEQAGYAPRTDYAPQDDYDTEEQPHSTQSNGSSASSSGPVLSPEQLVSEGTRLTTELLKGMGFEATVTATAEADRVDVTAAVTGDEELLTGPKGEVRQALQHLLNRMLNRGEGSRYHLQLEVNEFWKRRETELETLARDLANEALTNQSEAVTEYLNAQERRIVHMTLKTDTRVKTYALGSGLIKRVAVAPADFPEGPDAE
jgi:predicted RNA-binding protein Jag